jgi:hypothetical protein
MTDTNDLPISLTAVTNRGNANHLSIKDRARNIFHMTNMKAKTDIREAAHVLRIMVFLHNAKDFPTVLKVYGIESTSETK